MQKKNDTQQINAEIQMLKELLLQKVMEHKCISHPEVLSISKKLDEKINVCMRYLNNLDTEVPQE